MKPMFKMTALSSILALSLGGAALAQGDESNDTKFIPDAPGEYAGYAVQGEHGQFVGNVTLSIIDPETGELDRIMFKLPNGNEVEMDGEDVLAVGDGVITLSIPESAVDSLAKSELTDIEVIK
ncbi:MULTISPECIES: hypothetical protein [Actibacterium]|uniref:Sporulation protein YlmC with PRC-barrel domain n=1 Tax=Actibacterium naphthalenivorans TaxID=1614693 RepID=A0A840CMI2_9RHOB|nr:MULTISPECIES: hypothetical protein [Actibacterium]ALG90620.1 hypothetical protein TQ29_10980 [Actibacterium sp. EMB200-NS6]MBB4023207.1 sporulation protein YlmC with PRC-barrel domain [Actibacterium naphthalenivorans]